MNVETIGVVGAGTMGHGIAQVAAQAGYQVRLYDLSPQLVEKGIQRIAENLDAGVSKGKVAPQDRDLALKRVTTTTDFSLLAGCQLVIEAAPEQLSLKQDIFRRLSAISDRNAVLASNTSSLSIDQIAAATEVSSRILGMHFFNPVHLMRLLEIIRGPKTSDEALEVAKQVAARMKKEVIVVRDSPGFATSRLGIALGMEAIRMLEDGVASAGDIDRAMELGYGHPMGPLRLTDLVGLDVRLAIGEYLHRELGNPAFEPPQLLRKLVAAGKLGKKTGEGFYRY